MTMRPHDIRRRLHAFLAGRDGAITVEFVIIFPLLMMVIFLIVFVSLLLSTTSDVQQVASDLARKSLSQVGADDVPDICVPLRQNVLPSLIEDALLLQADKLTLEPCPDQPDAGGFVTVTVTYNFAGSFVQSLGQSLGADLGIITRSARVMP